MKIPVFCIHFNKSLQTPLALGMLVSFCRKYKGGLLNEYYDFDQHIFSTYRALRKKVTKCKEPAVFLFSDYIWNLKENLTISSLISKEGITIHGGPSVPKNEETCELFLAENKHIDICVHGEGEIALAEALEALIGHNLAGNDSLPLSLGSVSGLTYRTKKNGESFSWTPKREPFYEVDAFPSPYLDGFFDDKNTHSAKILRI